MSEDKNNTLLGIRDIVIMNVIAILSLRQIPNVAPYGASAMLLWLLAAIRLYGARVRHLARIGREPDIHRCELHCDLLVPHLHEH